MDQLRSLMQSALAQRLAEHLRAEVAPVANIPSLPQQDAGQRIVGGLRLGTMLPRDLLDTLGLAREGLDYGAKALTGGIAQEVGGLQSIDNPVLRNIGNAASFLLPGGPVTALTALATEAGRIGLPSPFGPTDVANAQRAAGADQGNFISKARAANEGLAQDSPLATGLLNQLVNPLTYATGGGTEEARAAQQAGRIASGLGLDLNTVNTILYPEGHLIGKASSAILGPAVRGVLGRTGLNEILRQRYDLPVAPEAGDLATYLGAQGLPAPDKVPFESSPLAPEKKPNIFQMARQAGARAKAGAQPALLDLPAGGAAQARLLDDRLQPPTSPVSDLLGAARQASADLAPPATPQADPLGLMRDLLKSGDNGKEMVYAPADPAFWSKRVGVDPAAVPDLLRQLTDEGSLAPDHTGDLLNTYLAGGDRTPVAPDLPGGSLDLPAMPAYSGTRAEALGQFSSDEINQLVNLAYPTQRAQASAILKYTNPADLASAALDRITTNRTLAENLAVQYPDLAGKVAYLPEPDTGGGDVLGLMARLKGTPQTPEERAAWQARYAGQSQTGTDILAQGDKVAGSAVTQADLNAMSPEGRMAALGKLAGGDDVSGLTPGLAGEAATAGELVPGTLPAAMPANNYRTTLATYTDRLYRQADIGETLAVLDPARNGDGGARDLFFSNTPDLALGQGGNKAGVLIEYDPVAIQGQVNRGKPGADFAWQQGGAEFVDRLGRPNKLNGAVRSVTVPPQLGGSPGERLRLRRTLDALEAQGWRKADAGPAGLRYTPPGGGGDVSGLTPQPRPGLGGIAGWLTRPLTTGPGVTRLGVAGSGGLIGAAAGGLAPAESEDQRRIHALQGAAVGAGLGLGTTTKAGQNIVSSLPVAKEFAGNLIGAANVAQREAMDRSNKGITSFTNLANSWRVQQTSTVRNLLQDELTARLWNSNAGIRQQMMNDNWSSLVQLWNLGKANGYDALPMQTTGLLDKWGLTGYMPNIGAGFNNVNESLIKDLSAADMAKMEAIFAGLNPAQGGVPLAGAALGAVKGYTRAWQEKIFSTLNEFTRLAARHAAFQDEFAPAMQVAAHDFVARHGAAGVLDPAAGFSAADVGQALGQQAQDEWAGQVEKVTHLAERRALDIHGDFTRKAAGQSKGAGDLAANLFNTAVPFSSWALKAYPRTAAMMLDHPGVSLAIMLLTMGQAEKVQREGKAGLVGGVPIDANTPLVGGVAKKMLGNFPGQAYVNLLGSLTPVSTSALLSSDQPVNANLYQQAGEALDRAGFSFNPLIQAAAYATNKDYQRPAPMSRTAGLEMALPGPDMPSLALGPLNAARKLAGGSEQHTTTEDRKLAELFYLSTGHQISDPSNVSDPQRAALLASTLDPNSPIRKLAAESTGQANVARNLVSLVSPVSLQAAPRVEQQAEAASYAARHAPPANYDPRTINALMNSGNMAQYIEAVMRQRANVGTQGEVSPLLQLTSQSSGQDRASMYLQALGASSIFGSPLVGAPQSLINQILGLSTPSVEIGGPQGGQR